MYVTEGCYSHAPAPPNLQCSMLKHSMLWLLLGADVSNTAVIVAMCTTIERDTAPSISIPSNPRCFGQRPCLLVHAVSALLVLCMLLQAAYWQRLDSLQSGESVVCGGDIEGSAFSSDPTDPLGSTPWNLQVSKVVP